MKVVYTDEAVRDLDEILTFLAENYPTVVEAFRRRVREIERRISRWPNSAREVEQHPGVRVVSFIRYPYGLFYEITGDIVVILHVHHTARQEPWNDDTR
jgi:toxin ParE1/3/4